MHSNVIVTQAYRFLRHAETVDQIVGRNRKRTFQFISENDLFQQKTSRNHNKAKLKNIVHIFNQS